jgi:hypothetical protein
MTCRTPERPYFAEKTGNKLKKGKNPHPCRVGDSNSTTENRNKLRLDKAKTPIYGQKHDP